MKETTRNNSTGYYGEPSNVNAFNNKTSVNHGDLNHVKGHKDYFNR